MRTLNFLTLLSVGCMLIASAFAADTAEAIMKKAQEQARVEKKNIFVMFHASWCGWCHRFDGFLAEKDMGKLMNDRFVIVHLDVQEHAADKKPLENAGGEDLMKAWGGENAGLPFMAILNPNGKVIINSLRPVEGKKGENTGYPAAPEEIGHFITMLQKGSRMTADERASIEKWLKEHAPKSG